MWRHIRISKEWNTAPQYIWSSDSCLRDQSQPWHHNCNTKRGTGDISPWPQGQEKEGEDTLEEHVGGAWEKEKEKGQGTLPLSCTSPKIKGRRRGGRERRRETERGWMGKGAFTDDCSPVWTAKVQTWTSFISLQGHYPWREWTCHLTLTSPHQASQLLQLPTKQSCAPPPFPPPPTPARPPTSTSNISPKLGAALWAVECKGITQPRGGREEAPFTLAEIRGTMGRCT